jgi:hypothetical protein
MRRRKLNSNGASKSRPEENLLNQLSSPLRDFVKDFKAHGKGVLEQVRERNPEKYLELSAKLAGLVATLKPQQPDGYSKARSKEEIAIALLKQMGVAEDQMTAPMIEQAMAANEFFIARLEAIRDDQVQGKYNGDAEPITLG